jgi:uncharacterized protein (DUF2236 family)
VGLARNSKVAEGLDAAAPVAASIRIVDQRRSSVVGRKINREIVVVVGWGRAILLQLAHPLIAAAIADGSSFHGGAGSYVRRAHQTISAMLDLTFGTADQAQRIVDRINGIHDHVHGRLGTSTGIFPAGTPYSARDGRLLVWVHVTLVESLLLTYEQLVGPLRQEEKDQYAADSAWLARELGAPGDAVPADTAAVEAFSREVRSRGEICVGDDARRMAAALLAPPVAIAAPVFWASELITVGLLPDDLRQAYGFEWNDRQARRFQRVTALVRGTRRVLPRICREWPAARRQ